MSVLHLPVSTIGWGLPTGTVLCIMKTHDAARRYVYEKIVGRVGCFGPFGSNGGVHWSDGGTGSRELLALVPAFGNVLFLLLGDLSRRRLKKCK